ncbi:hypothetical protein EKK97_09600 [Billgrantia tianxiuensis]|uniref:Lipoprotein n=2 Tax=Billgrantia tianxiuensis TaxID=2497861 RepID=A0A6I6SPQ5_9GAMM|nr:hypothetical protein [Halomonas sp. MCCC 1A11057]MCE8032169.1 hypothetical protein [Halomonas sp. MCCC 1A11057]QHC49810.1 hypothetical protein EKK97_09600 [Halomonas tianxiuensis]
MRFLLMTGFFSIFMNFLTGCKAAEIVHYEHRPSMSFYSELNFDLQELDGYKDREILFTISVKQASFEEYWAWLGLYAKEAPDIPVYVLGANFIGDGWKESYQVDSEVLFGEEATDSGLVTKGVLLYKIKGELLKRFEKESAITLEVIYSMDGEEKVMNFLLERRVERQTVFPT